MIKPKFFGTAKGGRFIADDHDLMRNHLTNLEGQRVELTVARQKKVRSSGQPGEPGNVNGYYWGVVVRIISDAMGELDDQVTHNILQMMFNKRAITVAGHNIEVPAGTKEMDSAAFSDYCSRIRMWANMPGNITGRGVYIPEPNEAEYDI